MTVLMHRMMVKLAVGPSEWHKVLLEEITEDVIESRMQMPAI